MFTTKIKTTGPTKERVAQHWKGSTFKDLLKFIALSMGRQARVNIIKFGGPGGKWERLQGFRLAKLRARVQAQIDAGLRKRGRQRQSFRRQRANLFSRIGGDVRQNMIDQAQEAAKKENRKRGAAAYVKQRRNDVEHAGYALRKADGKTPGAGKYGPNVVLRDTGEMAANMTGRIRVEPGAVYVTMVSEGQEPGRKISNNDLFIAHATGAGNLPVRNPAEDMAFFENEANAAAQLFMEKAPK